MKWFKHFSDASKSLKINELIDNLGLEGYARWFLLLELLNNELTQEDIDSKNSTFQVHFREISTKVHIKFRKKLVTFLQKLSDFSLLSFEISGNFIKIDCPILLDLQNKDSKYNRKRVVSKSLDTTLDKIRLDKIRKDNILSLNEKEKTIFDDVRQSWNNICADNGKLKHSIGLKSTTTQNFFKLLKLNPKLKNIDTWENCFEHIRSDTFLNGSNSASNFVCTLDWLIDKEKIIDVLNGQFGGNNNAVDLFALVNSESEASNV